MVAVKGVAENKQGELAGLVGGRAGKEAVEVGAELDVEVAESKAKESMMGLGEETAFGWNIDPGGAAPTPRRRRNEWKQ